MVRQSSKVTKVCLACGEKFLAYPSEISRGRIACSRSCGYLVRREPRFNDIAGQTFNNLTAIKRVDSIRLSSGDTKVRWLCLCTCGTQVEVTSGQLTRTDGKETRSCGCLNHLPRELSHHWKSSCPLSSSHWKSVLSGARSRGLSVSITIDEAYGILVKQEFKCALSGVPITLQTDPGDSGRKTKTASLDRIDSNFGYEPGNVQWVHKTINRMKSNLPEYEFIAWCRNVVDTTN